MRPAATITIATCLTTDSDDDGDGDDMHLFAKSRLCWTVLLTAALTQSLSHAGVADT